MPLKSVASVPYLPHTTSARLLIVARVHESVLVLGVNIFNYSLVLLQRQLHQLPKQEVSGLATETRGDATGDTFG